MSFTNEIKEFGCRISYPFGLSDSNDAVAVSDLEGISGTGYRIRLFLLEDTIAKNIL